jgi:O-acetyl-ADP-ribose deacetylase (regulator of RNase III)
MKQLSMLVLFFTMMSFFGCSGGTERPTRNYYPTQSFSSKGSADTIQKNSKCKLSVVNQDITKMKVGAIVNAANETLLGGGGIDKAIHVAAGSGLKDACVALPEVSPGIRCNTGQAKITPGFNLPATNVIHTVGPIYKNYDDATAAKLLADCYTNSLTCAKEKGVRTVAFPCISTGAFGYPKDKAASIALTAVRGFLASNEADFDEITFVCYGSDTAESYKIYESLINPPNSPTATSETPAAKSETSPVKSETSPAKSETSPATPDKPSPSTPESSSATPATSPVTAEPSKP